MSATKKKNRYERKFLIESKLGLHARPAALFVQTANRFNCDVEVRIARVHQYLTAWRMISPPF